jgi:hypothetical protein
MNLLNPFTKISGQYLNNRQFPSKSFPIQHLASIHSEVYSLAAESDSKCPARTIPCCCYVYIAMLAVELAPELTRHTHENTKDT